MDNFQQKLSTQLFINSFNFRFINITAGWIWFDSPLPVLFRALQITNFFQISCPISIDISFFPHCLFSFGIQASDFWFGSVKLFDFQKDISCPGVGIIRQQLQRFLDACFRLFVVSLPFQGSILILARTYFARSDTVRPTIYSLVSIGVAWILAVFLVKNTDLGPAGLSLAFSIGSTLNALLLWTSLKLPFAVLWRDSESRTNFPPIFFGGVIAGAVMLISYKIFTPLATIVLAGPSVQNLFVIIASLFCGLAVYGYWAKMFKLEQWHLIKPSNHSTPK